MSISRRVLQIVLSLGIGVCALVLALRDVQFDLLGASLSKLDAGWLLLGILGVIAVALAKAVRWRAMFVQHPHGPRYSDVLSALVIGQTLNMLLPFRAGELARAHVLKRSSSVSLVQGLGTVISEKLMDLAVFGGIALILLLVSNVPDWFRDAAFTLLGVSAVLIVLIGLFYSRSGWQDKLIRRLPFRFRERVHRAFTNLSAGWSVIWKPGMRARIWMWSIMIWLLSLLTPAAMANAMGIHMPVSALIMLVLVLQIGFILPSPPGAIGVIQYLCVLVLTLYAIDSTLAFAYGVALNAVIALPLVLYSAVLWIQMIRKPPASEDSPPFSA